MWATPTIPDRRLGVNDDYYAWVIGGCPNQDVRIVQNGESARIELSTPTFKFKDSEILQITRKEAWRRGCDAGSHTRGCEF